MSNSLAQAAVTVGGLFESAYYEGQNSEENSEQIPTKEEITEQLDISLNYLDEADLMSQARSAGRLGLGVGFGPEVGTAPPIEDVCEEQGAVHLACLNGPDTHLIWWESRVWIVREVHLWWACPVVVR